MMKLMMEGRGATNRKIDESYNCRRVVVVGGPLTEREKVGVVEVGIAIGEAAEKEVVNDKSSGDGEGCGGVRAWW